MQTSIRLVCAAMLASAALDAATIAYWRFEEGAGTVIHDSSGNGNNGTLSGGAVFSTIVPWATVPLTGAPDVYSLQLNGTSAAGSVPDSPTLRPGSAFTVEAMINANNQSLGWVILGKQFHNGFTNSFQLEITDGKLRFQLTNTSNRDSFVWISAPSAGWHHVAGEWDGSKMTLFLDGILMGSTAFTGPIGWDINPVLIGADNDSVVGGSPRCCWFNGLIDEVRLSDVALDPKDFIMGTTPEPSSLCLLGSGILFFVARFRGRRSRSQ